MQTAWKLQKSDHASPWERLAARHHLARVLF